MPDSTTIAANSGRPRGSTITRWPITIRRSDSTPSTPGRTLAEVAPGVDIFARSTVREPALALEQGYTGVSAPHAPGTADDGLVSFNGFEAFTSDIASLPRIVTLNNMTIAMPSGATTPLTLEATAKTFRYLDQEEIDAQRKAAAGPKKP